MSDIPTDQEVLAHEKFNSFRIGWTDGAKGAPRQDKFMRHATRPDLTAFYVNGFNAGAQARVGALNSFAAEIDYVPNILREAPA